MRVLPIKNINELPKLLDSKNAMHASQQAEPKVVQSAERKPVDLENYTPLSLELGIRHIKGEENLRVDKKLISV